ncbi:MAG TPA: hypothetical protein VMA09_22885 [Candidatus Binataceae bacterium]|nr:hypothetical protein [Candidatus Binataceae bacterium]
MRYVDVPLDEWRANELRRLNLPDHFDPHILTTARLYAANRYDRMTRDVEAITGHPATSVCDFVLQDADVFGRR